MKLLNSKRFKKTKIYKVLMKIIRVPYYYVPPCPNCNNKATGRIVPRHGSYENQWAFIESLKHGELTAIQDDDTNEDTTFCMACGYTWNGLIEFKMLSYADISEQKRIRGTAEYLAQALDMKEDEDKEKESNRGFFVNAIAKSIGHL